MLKLNLGCGGVYLNGWVNIDIDSEKADLRHDLNTPLPYEDNTIDFIYNEHFIEHLTVEQGMVLLNECRRVLKPDGTLRIATPDLDYIIFKYIFSWKRQDWIKTFGYQYLKTKAEMLNLCFHEWGHKYLYNAEELKRRLMEAGFKDVHKQKIGKSGIPELRNLETRKDSRLVIEAIKY